MPFCVAARGRPFGSPAGSRSSNLSSFRRSAFFVGAAPNPPINRTASGSRLSATLGRRNLHERTCARPSCFRSHLHRLCTRSNFSSTWRDRPVSYTRPEELAFCPTALSPLVSTASPNQRLSSAASGILGFLRGRSSNGAPIVASLHTSFVAPRPPSITLPHVQKREILSTFCRSAA